jgi:hypothetical protein
LEGWPLTKLLAVMRVLDEIARNRGQSMGAYS